MDSLPARSNPHALRDPLEVDHGRLGIKVLEYLVSSLVFNELRYAALRVNQAAEDQGPRRAGLRAGRRKVAVADFSAFRCGLELCLYNSLNAEGTFLHYSLLSHRNIRIQLPLERFGPGEGKPVEAPHLVRIVLRAKTRSKAAIVNLVIETFYAVLRSENRAHVLTRRVVTMLAKHYKPVCPFFVIVEISLDPYPGHLPPHENLVAFHDGDIVFRVASDYAGAAADAAVQVHDHRPAIVFIGVTRIEIFRRHIAFRQGVIDVGLFSSRRHSVTFFQADHRHKVFIAAMEEKTAVSIGNFKSPACFFDS